jgi:cell wall assembly regulator SMI1
VLGVETLKKRTGRKSPTPGMKELLGRLERWLARHRPQFLQGLLPGASAADLDRLQADLGMALPPDLRTLLAWHNGQSDESPARFEEDWILMGSRQIAEAKRELDADATETGWQAAWIPFLDDDAGDYLGLDTRRPGAAVREFWQDRTEHLEIAPSLPVWLESVVSAMERGEYEEDPERGSFIRK